MHLPLRFLYFPCILQRQHRCCYKIKQQSCNIWKHFDVQIIRKGSHFCCVKTYSRQSRNSWFYAVQNSKRLSNKAGTESRLIYPLDHVTDSISLNGRTKHTIREESLWMISLTGKLTCVCRIARIEAQWFEIVDSISALDTTEESSGGEADDAQLTMSQVLIINAQITKSQWD